MSLPAMEQLVDLLLADRQPDLKAYFDAHGARLEHLVWSPTTAVTDNAPMRFVIEYWHHLQKQCDGVPKASALSPFDLKPALGHVVLIDVLDDGWDGRFRVYGTKVAETYGRDMTGRLISEIDGGNYVSTFFRCLYRAAWLRQQPYYSHHYPPPHVAVESWQRVALPLAGEDGRISRFLACNIAGPWRPPARRPQADHPTSSQP